MYNFVVLKVILTVITIAFVAFLVLFFDEIIPSVVKSAKLCDKLKSGLDQLTFRAHSGFTR